MEKCIVKPTPLKFSSSYQGFWEYSKLGVEFIKIILHNPHHKNKDQTFATDIDEIDHSKKKLIDTMP
jgi:hypothetical protein